MQSNERAPFVGGIDAATLDGLLELRSWWKRQDFTWDGSNMSPGVKTLLGGTMGHAHKQPLLHRGQLLDAEAQMVTSLEALTPPKLSPDEMARAIVYCKRGRWPAGDLMEGWFAAEVEP